MKNKLIIGLTVVMLLASSMLVSANAYQGWENDIEVQKGLETQEYFVVASPYNSTNATVDLELTGNADNYVDLERTQVELEPGESQRVYMEVRSYNDAGEVANVSEFITGDVNATFQPVSEDGQQTSGATTTFSQQVPLGIEIVEPLTSNNYLITLPFLGPLGLMDIMVLGLIGLMLLLALAWFKRDDIRDLIGDKAQINRDYI